MTIFKSLVKNTFARTMTELINRFGAAIFWVLVARQLGASALGALAFAMSLFSFFLTVSTLGLGSVVIRDVARDRKKAGAYFGQTILFGSGSAFVLALVMILVALFIKPNPKTILAAAIMAAAIVPASWFYWSKSLLSAMENMQHIAIARFGENLFKVVVGISLLFYGGGVLMMAMVIALSKLVSAVIAFVLASRLARPEFKIRRDILAHLYHLTPSFSMIALFNSLFWAAPVIILTRFGGESQAGLYSAAYKLVDMVVTFAHAYGQALFPIASRTARQDAAAFRTLFLKSIKYVSILTLAVAAGISVLSTEIVAVIYGADMAEVAGVLRVLIWMSAPFAIVPILAYSLMSHNRQISDLIGNIAAAGTVILLGVFCSASFGALGMAWSVVAACVVFWSVEFFSVQRDVLSFSFGEQVWRPALGALLLAGLLTALRGSNLFLEVGLSGVGYITFLILSRTITKNEWKMVKQLKSAQ